MLKKINFTLNINLCSFCLLMVFCSSSAATDLVRYVYSEEHPDAKQAYFIDLVTLALEVTKPEYGDYDIKGFSFEMSQGRSSRMLEKNEHITLTWRMTSKDLEKKLQPIYVPLIKGIMGYRIFMIRKGEQHLFPRTLTLSQLKKKHAGQGLGWPDSDILEDNGYNLVKGNAINLLDMLTTKRFDYYPRALHEPWVEINENNNDKFVVEKNFLLRYRSPIYFFVNKDNIRLASRLNKGLTRLVESGEFDRFFSTHPITSNILARSNRKERIVFELTNPLLSEKTREIAKNSSMWLKEKSVKNTSSKAK